MNFNFNNPSVPFNGTQAVIRINLPPGALVPWLPVANCLNSLLLIPNQEEIQIQSEICKLTSQANFCDKWLAFKDHKVLPVDIKISNARFVSNNDILCIIKSEHNWLINEILERFLLLSKIQTMAWVYADIRELLRRLGTRFQIDDALEWSASSCVTNSNNLEQQLAASLIFNQLPTTILSTVNNDSVVGNKFYFYNSIANDLNAVKNLPTDQPTFWFTNDVKQITELLNFKHIIPVIPRYRDITYVSKFAQFKTHASFKEVNTKFAFIANTITEAKTGFISLTNLGISPKNIYAILKFNSDVMPFVVSNENVVDDTLVDIQNLNSLNYHTATNLLFQ